MACDTPEDSNNRTAGVITEGKQSKKTKLASRQSFPRSTYTRRAENTNQPLANSAMEFAKEECDVQPKARLRNIIGNTWNRTTMLHLVNILVIRQISGLSKSSLTPIIFWDVRDAVRLEQRLWPHILGESYTRTQGAWLRSSRQECHIEEEHTTQPSPKTFAPTPLKPLDRR